MHHERFGTGIGMLLAAGLAGFGAGLLARQNLPQRYDDGLQRAARDSAPGRTAKRRWFGSYAVTGKTVHINRPREELYAFWRDFSNLPAFMPNIESVRSTGEGRAVWTIAAPAGRTVEVETEIVDERENELIAWRSVPSSQIVTQGRVAFRDAPEGKGGTYVEALIAYEPPAGELGRLIAKLFQREPAIQGRRELKRFKMLMETGEVATARNQREAA